MSAMVVERVGKTFAPPPRLLRPFMRVAARTSVDALRDVSFTVADGEIVALVGPNGAGKTTLIKIISTLLVPTSGAVSIAGVDALAHPMRARARLGLVLSEDRGLYWRMTGRGNLEFFAVLAGLPKAEARARSLELLRQVGVDGADKLVFGYSSGMRTRLNIARALLADPPLLLLDEPTRSLDPMASDLAWRLVRDLADRGKAVLVSTHDIPAVTSWCDRVLVLVGGGLRLASTMAELSVRGSPESAITEALGQVHPDG